MFLDRDGTINVDKEYLSDPNDVEIIPGVADKIAEFNRYGYKVIIITNQSGIERGLMTEKDLVDVNLEIGMKLINENKEAKITGLFVCPHSPENPCECRKPNPMMLFMAKDHFNVNLESSFMIGDKESDVEAGIRAGCKSILLTGELT